MAEPEDDDGQDDETIPLPGGDPIIPMRGERVILAARVAEAFGVQTRQVVQAVKRNLPKFPFPTAFELTAEETEVLRSQGVISKPGRGGSRALPWVLTHLGVVRLATVMDTPAALAATDIIIKLFVEVFTQVKAGRTQIAVSNPTSLVPDGVITRQLTAMRLKMVDAIESLLDTVIDTKSKTTLREEIQDLGSSALDHFRQRLKTRGLENAKLDAEIMRIVAEAEEIRERTAASRRKSQLEELTAKINIVKQLMEMTRELEPNAMVNLLGDFSTAPKILPPKPRRIAGPAKPKKRE